jgi:signal transduction histidine kinase
LFLDDLPGRPGARADARALSESMEAARVARSAWCPIKSEGRVTHVLGVTSPDLSEHDFVAIQLFANQLGAAERLCALRAELIRNERLAAVGEMAAVLAHEVRNPVTVVLNAVTTLRRLAQDDSTLSLLDIVVEEIGRLRRLVDDLLDFANPSSPSLEPVPPVDLVASALESARHDAAFESKSPRVELDIDAALPEVEVDTHLARRALVNLLVNAFQHVPPGGAVSIGAAAEPGAVCLTIHNEGPRIDPNVAARIFEPFFTTMPSGSGLGLAIVKRILASLGGAVELAPRDEGATFEVRLPVAR